MRLGFSANITIFTASADLRLGRTCMKGFDLLDVWIAKRGIGKRLCLSFMLGLGIGSGQSHPEFQRKIANYPVPQPSWRLLY